MKKTRRNKAILNFFKLFYKEVYIKKINSKDIGIRCSKPYLKKDMILEAKYNNGLGSKEEMAYAVSHFAHAYFYNKYGISVTTPFNKENCYVFYISNAYRTRRTH